MKSLIELLLFIALISIIFGVSMHDAFWGIIAFIVWAIVLVFVAIFASSGVLKFLDWANSPPAKPTSPQTQKIKQPSPQKTQNTKKHPIIGWVVSFIVSYMFFDLLFIATGLFEKLIDVPIVVIVLIPAIPFLCVLSSALIKRSAAKKPRKAKKG